MRQNVFTGNVALAGMVLSLCGMAGTALANPGDLYVERIGEMEFQGQLIARPLQPEAQAKRGLSAEEAQAEQLEARRIVEAAMSRLVEYVPQTDEYVFAIKPGTTENEVIQQMTATGLFEYVEPNWRVWPLACPNDSRFSSAWHHPIMQSCDAWDVHTGTSAVAVGICDTGIRTTHEDLLLNRLEGYNAVDRRWESAGGNIGAINPHGTQTTGCAAANGNNSRGTSGMGWNLSHMMARVSNRSDGSASFNDITHGARVCAESGCFAVNASYSGVTNSSARSTADYIRGLGGMLFWSAGNSAQNMTSPDRDSDDLLVVGATTSGDTRASFSSYGNYMDFVAPGNGVFTTNSSSNTSYANVSGTSFASPIAAGVAALLKSADPSMTADEIEDLMKTTAVDLGNPGLDIYYGYGRVDSGNAMTNVGTLQLSLSDEPLFAGEEVTFFVTSGEPFTDTGVFYSIQGESDDATFIPGLGVSVDLINAVQVGGLKETNSQGDTFWTVTVPNVPRPLIVWFQAAQSNGTVSVVHITQANP